MEISLSPSGQLRFQADPATEEAVSGRSFPSRLAKAFSRDPSDGLLLLAAEKQQTGLSASLLFWRELSARYLVELCHTPEPEHRDPSPIEPPEEWLRQLAEAPPPMQGAEYLNVDVLADRWIDLDAYVHRLVVAHQDGLPGVLADRAPAWHQVGRVCFHLAENKRDPDRPFAFLATYAAGLSAGGQVRHQPLSKALVELAGAKNRRALVKLLSPVQLASQRSGWVAKLVESNDVYSPLAWTAPEAYGFLREIPAMEESGIVVRVPDWWRKRPRPQIAVTVGQKQTPLVGVNALLDFHINAVLGDETLTKKELEQLLAAEEGLVLLRGQWVEVDRQRLQEALDQWQMVQQSAGDGLSFIEGMRLLAGAPRDLDAGAPTGGAIDWSWSQVRPGEWLGQLLDGLRDPERLEAIRPGRELHATLRPYQQTGTAWLHFLTGMGLGACLADDMGLGKTIQVIALLLVESKARTKKSKPSLLVLPASLLANWKAELERFAPSLRARFVHLSRISKEELAELAADPAAKLAETDAVLTTYGMLRRQEWLLDVPWRLVVLDEAQAIKNPTSIQTRTVKRLRGDARIALTGTPIENRLSDLWSLFDFLCPGLLGSEKKFQEFVKQLNAREPVDFGPLRRLVSPYILRRLKTDRRIIDDLPEKTEMKTFCGLSKRQAAIYTKLVREMAHALEDADGIQRRGLVLSYLMRFKQLCNHPSQITGDGEFDPAESGKFQRLADLCDEIASRQEKTLVFTQFREMTEPLREFLTRRFGRSGLVLHGGTAVGRRQGLIDEFQREDGPPFFVLSLKAGGTGLNLTAASHVIHFDRWWNPAVENQATDRAFRIGQKKNVMVHKFVCLGTVEEKIDALIDSKIALADEILKDGAEKTLTEMSNDELLRMVSLDIQRASV